MNINQYSKEDITKQSLIYFKDKFSSIAFIKISQCIMTTRNLNELFGGSLNLQKSLFIPIYKVNILFYRVRIEFIGSKKFSLIIIYAFG